MEFKVMTFTSRFKSGETSHCAPEFSRCASFFQEKIPRMKNTKNPSDGSRDTKPLLVALVGQFEMLDPATVVFSKYALRQSSPSDDVDFIELKKLIEDAGVNVTRIQVRRRVTDVSKPDEVTLEVISGHRILQVCRELKIKVAALIVDNLDDIAFIRHMVFSNAARKSPGAWESGWAFRRLIEDKIFTSQSHLVRELCKPRSDVSNSISLTKLPDIVIDAFGRTSALQHAHAKPLKDSLVKNEASVLATAEKLAKMQAELVKKISPREVLEALIASASTCSAQAEGGACTAAEVLTMNSSRTSHKTSVASSDPATTDSLIAEARDQSLRVDDHPETAVTADAQLLRRHGNSAAANSAVRASNEWPLILDGAVLGRLSLDEQGGMHLELEAFDFTFEDCMWFLNQCSDVLKRSRWLSGSQLQA